MQFRTFFFMSKTTGADHSIKLDRQSDWCTQIKEVASIIWIKISKQLFGKVPGANMTPFSKARFQVKPFEYTLFLCESSFNKQKRNNA